MSDSKGSFEFGGSWSSDHEPTESGVSVRDVEFVLGDKMTVVVALLQGSVDPQGGSPVIPEGEFLRNP